MTQSDLWEDEKYEAFNGLDSSDEEEEPEEEESE